MTIDTKTNFIDDSINEIQLFLIKNTSKEEHKELMLRLRMRSDILYPSIKKRLSETIDNFAASLDQNLNVDAIDVILNDFSSKVKNESEKARIKARLEASFKSADTNSLQPNSEITKEELFKLMEIEIVKLDKEIAHLKNLRKSEK